MMKVKRGRLRDEGLNQLLCIVEWDNPDAVCEEILGLIGELIPIEYE